MGQPLNNPPFSGTEAHLQAAAKADPLRILLADDNPTFMLALRKHLGLVAGTQVIAEAHDGFEALRKTAELHPDLLLLDIDMPGLSGLKVAATMQNWPHRPEVVFLSLHDGPSYRAAAKGLGALAYVGKSELVEELGAVLDQLRRGRSNPGSGARS